MVTDLSPIRELGVKKLNMVYCLVETMRDIPYSSLEHLRIDMNQLKIMLDENIQLPVISLINVKLPYREEFRYRTEEETLLLALLNERYPVTTIVQIEAYHI